MWFREVPHRLHPVVKNWPSPITFAGFLFGQTPAVNGARLTSSKTLPDPRRAFQSYNGGVDNGGWGEQLTKRQ